MSGKEGLGKKTFDAGIVLQTIYDFERDFRIENALETGFYGSLVTNTGKFLPRGMVDSYKQGDSQVLVETDEIRLNRLGAMAVIDWADRYNSASLDDLASQMLQSFRQDHALIKRIAACNKTTKVADMLGGLHSAGFTFRIQTAWDLGFNAWLLDNSIVPS